MQIPKCILFIWTPLSPLLPLSPDDTSTLQNLNGFQVQKNSFCACLEIKNAIVTYKKTHMQTQMELVQQKFFFLLHFYTGSSTFWLSESSFYLFIYLFMNLFVVCIFCLCVAGSATDPAPAGQPTGVQWTLLPGLFQHVHRHILTVAR
jgi:hypothetical protein